jgi:hypothetical protein
MHAFGGGVTSLDGPCLQCRLERTTMVKARHTRRRLTAAIDSGCVFGCCADRFIVGLRSNGKTREFVFPVSRLLVRRRPATPISVAFLRRKAVIVKSYGSILSTWMLPRGDRRPASREYDFCNSRSRRISCRSVVVLISASPAPSYYEGDPCLRWVRSCPVSQQ